MGRKEFIKHNEGFTCLHCKRENSPAQGSERNHCFSCLYSLHVDQETPGDRASLCKGIMEPISIEYRGDKGFMILHRCHKCRREMKNRAAADDNIDLIAKLGAI